MSDLMHDHTDHGFHRGCEACEQTRRDLRASLATYALTNTAEAREKEGAPA